MLLRLKKRRRLPSKSGRRFFKPLFQAIFFPHFQRSSIKEETQGFKISKQTEIHLQIEKWKFKEKMNPILIYAGHTEV
jgi:hypothetical protein